MDKNQFLTYESSLKRHISIRNIRQSPLEKQKLKDLI